MQLSRPPCSSSFRPATARRSPAHTQRVAVGCSAAMGDGSATGSKRSTLLLGLGMLSLAIGGPASAARPTNKEVDNAESPYIQGECMVVHIACAARSHTQFVSKASLPF